MNVKAIIALAAVSVAMPSAVLAQASDPGGATEIGPDLTPGPSDYFYQGFERPYFNAPQPDIERFRQILDTRDGDLVLAFLADRAASGATWAMMQLGAFYAEGEFVEYSPVTSLNWFAMAARAGSPEAALILGAMYARGNVIKPDAEKASYWLAEASRLGDYQVKRDVERVAANQL